MAAELNPAAVQAIRYLLGYRFKPTDLDLISGYLAKKIKNEKLPISAMYEVNLYQYSPETLAEKYPALGENEWYFFTPRERGYRNGNRLNRAAGTGYWEANGPDKAIFSEDKRSIVGYKKVLFFREGNFPDWKRTPWIMHEFTIDKSRTNKRNANDMRLDDWVLCRIYKKATKVGKTNKQEAETCACIDQNHPSESTEVNISEIANDGNPAQI